LLAKGIKAEFERLDHKKEDVLEKYQMEMQSQIQRVDDADNSFTENTIKPVDPMDFPEADMVFVDAPSQVEDQGDPVADNGEIVANEEDEEEGKERG
jgi:hypothetical protein